MEQVEVSIKGVLEEMEEVLARVAAVVAVEVVTIKEVEEGVLVVVEVEEEDEVVHLMGDLEDVSIDKSSRPYYGSVFNFFFKLVREAFTLKKNSIFFYKIDRQPVQYDKCGQFTYNKYRYCFFIILSNAVSKLVLIF